MYVNPVFCSLSKYSEEELIGKNYEILNPDYSAAKFIAEMEQDLLKDKVLQRRMKRFTKHGVPYWVYATLVPVYGESGQIVQLISYALDITNNVLTEEKYKETLEELHNIENALDQSTVVAITNQRGIITYVNDKFCELSKYSAEELIGQTHGILNSGFHSRDFYKDMWRTIGMGQIWEGDIKNRAKDGLEYWVSTTIVPFLNEDNKPYQYIAIRKDITAQKEAEEFYERMAYYDFLTELPNRRNFEQKVREAIEQTSTKYDSFAVMFIDLDRFKNVNDSMGHEVGDRLLVAVGERLQKLVCSGAIVGRHGGDEYVILLPSIKATEAENVAKRIIEGLSNAFYIISSEVFISPSIGISIYPEDGKDYNALIRNADLAMFLSKEKSANNYRFFTADLQREFVEKTMLETELRKAQNKNQFDLHYQPQIDLKSGELKGVEALIRWHHPTEGTISPARFIPIAEENGLIVPIGQWVLETACLQAKEWQNNGFTPVQISVNVSIHQFKQRYFVEQVKETLMKTGLEPQYLNLEITESVTSDVQNCEMVFRQLREVGINVSIDDFGTGYSSLSYLSKFPITHLKIDQAFVQDLSRSNRAIIKTIISLAKNLDISVVAEGVETKEQAIFLKELHCDEAQGYLYSKPLPKEQIEALLRQCLVII